MEHIHRDKITGSANHYTHTTSNVSKYHSTPNKSDHVSLLQSLDTTSFLRVLRMGSRVYERT